MIKLIFEKFNFSKSHKNYHFFKMEYDFFTYNSSNYSTYKSIKIKLYKLNLRNILYFIPTYFDIKFFKM